MKRILVLALVTASTICYAQQGYDARAPGLDIVDNNGKVIKTIWSTELVDEYPEIPEKLFQIDIGWNSLRTHEHRDKTAVSRISSRMTTYLIQRAYIEDTAQRTDVKQWYADLAALNKRSFDRGTDVLKYNEANEAYKRDVAAYESTTVTDQNLAMMNAWYARLNTEHKRLIQWKDRIDLTESALRIDGVKLSDRADALNYQIILLRNDLDAKHTVFAREISHELFIADKRAEIEEQRDKIRKNNEGLRTLIDVSASVQEIEEWAELDKERREKGMWEAARSLLDVALAQTSMKYTAQEKVTRAELRRFKLSIMYKFKLHPDHVKKILKNWVDDGRSVLTIKTKHEFFKQIGEIANLAEGLDKTEKGNYLEAAATALGFFNKSPVLGLVVTNAQIYTGLFETALTYYESKQRVGQLMDLSESNLKAVAALADRNKELVAVLNVFKKELADLESRRTY